ncbi:hypothetical protein QL285_060283 [Trifolium repens]|nr:hypothetical protein QL285_060283 [Trifolium repens]
MTKTSKQMPHFVILYPLSFSHETSCYLFDPSTSNIQKNVDSIHIFLNIYLWWKDRTGNMMSRKRKTNDIKSRKVTFVILMSLSSKWRVSTESHSEFHLKFKCLCKSIEAGLKDFCFC